jgi:eukaryotic-like serine/threonine-protein kinase
VATPEQWPRIKEIVGAALEREPSERSAFLDQECLQEDVRAEVESLLAAHADADELSKNPWAVTTIADPVGEPKSIGPYRLIRILGVGGMGQVWLAEQTEPVRRIVALKLIRPGMFDAAVVRRFQSERQSLAIMDHPAIAKVFDAGATPAGQPYLVMEYVDGPPITDYCDRKRLNIRNRLRLFIQVCEGVQHAHQKAIIHRDLKPSNILVTEVDGKPVPRIIDFGLAKATVPHANGETLFTHVGGILGTPGYMSPDQADPNLRDVDTRSDVYSLGVILYELLTGFLPFDTARWKNRRLDEVLQQLRENDPQRPSAKVTGNRDTSVAPAKARGSEPRQLATVLQGDLDWVTMKALEKDRDRRYGTPTELAADIERYLDNRPVIARPTSNLYRIQKYARRHRVGVAVATGAFAVVVAFAVMQTLQLRRTTRERDRADRITQFMTRMFEVSDPGESRGNSVTAREILDKSSKEIDAGLAKDPEMKAQLLLVMGTVYHKLGLYGQAQSLLSRAVDIRSRMLGPEHPETLKAKERMALLYVAQGRYAEAEKFDRELIETQRRVLGPEHRETLATLSELFWALDMLGRSKEGEKIGRTTLEAQQRTLGMEDPDTLLSMRRLGSVLESVDRLPESEAMTRQIIEIRNRVSGPEHPETLLAMSDLGLVLTNEDRPAEAEKVLRETLAMQRRVLGSDHQNCIATMNALAVALQHQHKLDEAESLYREALDTSRRVMGAEHPGTLMEMGNLGTIFQDRKQYSEAERVEREVLAIRRRTLGTDHPDTALAMFNVADALHHEGRNAESAALYRETAEIQRRVLGPAHSDTLDTLYSLACVLASDHKPGEALAVLGEAVENGFPPANEHLDIQSDEELKALHGDPRFAAIVAEAQLHSASAASGPGR